jgi:hypothetical protein
MPKKARRVMAAKTPPMKQGTTILEQYAISLFKFDLSNRFTVSI